MYNAQGDSTPQRDGEALNKQLNFICPICQALVELSQDGYLCRNGHPFASPLGIPDFRIFDPPYVSRDEEMRRVNLLMERYDSMSFQELVTYHVRETANTNEPQNLVQQHTNFRIAAVVRGTVRLQTLKRLLGTMERDLESCSFALDVGCGSGGNIMALSTVFERVLGIDVSLEELILSKKRLEENGVGNVTLVCASAESLPFEEASFDFCNADSVIEHVRDQRKTIRETHRILRPEGIFFFNSPNRFSILLEPHVRVWGVGFLPRRFASPYVSLVRGIPYDGKRLLSFFELNKFVKDTYRENYQIFTIPGAYANMSKPASSAGGRIYRRLNKIPLISRLMRIVESCFLPFFEVIAFKKNGSPGPGA